MSKTKHGPEKPIASDQGVITISKLREENRDLRRSYTGRSAVFLILAFVGFGCAGYAFDLNRAQSAQLHRLVLEHKCSVSP